MAKRIVTGTGEDAASQTAEVVSRGWAGLFSRTFLSLKHRDYRFLWFGNLFFSGASWIQQVSLGWLVYDLTGSALLLGAVNGVRMLPFLIAAPVAGVAADRTDRRKLLISTQVFLAVVALIFAVDVAIRSLQVWHIFVFTFLIGSGTSFNQTVRQTLIPNVVPRKDLVNAIALSSAAFNTTRVLGPAVGGILIAVIGVAGNFFIQSAFYLAVAVSVFQIHPSQQDVAQPARQESPFKSFVDGLRYLKEDTKVRNLILLAFLPIVFAMPYVSLLPVFAEDVLRIGPQGLGLMMSATGLGALVGTLTLATLSQRRVPDVVLFVALSFMGIGLILFSLSHWLPVSLALLVFLGCSQAGFMATNNTLIQSAIPDVVRGRVMSIYNLDHGLVPLGSLLAGILAEFVGAPGALTIMGGTLIVLVLAAAALMRPTRRVKEPS